MVNPGQREEVVGGWNTTNALLSASSSAAKHGCKVSGKDIWKHTHTHKDSYHKN